MALVRTLLTYSLLPTILTCLFNQPFQIFSADSTDKSNTASGYTYAVTWATKQDGIEQHGFILRDYSIATSGFPLSYSASVSNINPSGADFNYNPSTLSRILKASFSIVVRKYCAGSIDLKTVYCTPSFLTQSPRSVDQETVNIPIGMPIVGNIALYTHQIFIASFEMVNKPAENRLAAYQLPLTASHLNNAFIPFICNSYARYNNVFKEVYITYIVIKQNSFTYPPIYYSNRDYGTGISFSIPSSFSTNLQQKCIVGNSFVATSSKPNLRLVLSGLSYTTSGGGSLYLSYNTFCLANCTAIRNFATYSPQTYTCSPCPSLPNCDICATTTTCAICLAGHFLNPSKQCDPCTLFKCNLCINATACEKCVDYYYVNENSICTPCPIITDCDMCDTATTCRICNLGYWVNATANGTCSLCNQFITGCDICTSDSTCSTCFNQYYVNTTANNICTNCSVSLTNCTLCNSISVCTQCTEWSFTDAGTGLVCKPCSTGVTNCQQCLSRTVCTVCNQKYYLNSSNLCNFCYVPLSNCDVCINDTHCVSCFSGYLTDDLSSYRCVTCQSAISQCLACISRTNCTSCRSQYYVDEMANFTCSLCMDAISNCITCSSNTTCTSCIVRYFVDAAASYSCTLCSIGISDCQNCTSNINCIGCFQGFYINPISTCTLCSLTLQNCKICSSGVNCTTCHDGYFKDHMDNGSCNTCPLSCESCISIYYCYSCFPTFYLDIIVTPYIRAQICRSCLADCLMCTDTTTCTVCLDGPPFRPVLGGCTKTLGCLQVNKSMASSQLRCIKCSFLYHLIDGVCNCTTGYRMVTELCTNVYGCIATQLIDNKVICRKCNFVLRFMESPTNNKCICIPGYQQFENTCRQKCGDGKRFQSQCDDGNMISGDGCSPNCTIQQDFTCIGGSAVGPSRCKYLPLDITMEIVSIKKLSMVNKALFTFQLQPFVYFYEVLNVTGALIFQPSNIITIQQMAISKGKISVLTSFNDDLQDKLASIDFTLNIAYFQQLKVNMQFNITMNGTMMFLRNLQKMQLYSKILRYLSLGVVCLFGISVFFHQMIGIQIIVPFQIIYLSHLVENNYTPVFSIFGYLANSAFNFQFYSNEGSIFQTIPANLQYSQQNREITNYLLVAIIIPFGVLASFNLFYRMLITEDQKIIKKSKLSEILFDKLLFPIVAASFAVVMPLSSGKSELVNIFPKVEIFYLFQRVIISLIFFYQWKQMLICMHQTIRDDSYFPNNFKDRYPSLYLTFLFLATFVLNNGFVQLFTSTHWHLLIISLLFMVIIVIYSPYQSKLDFFGIFMINLMMVSFFGWRVLRQMMVHSIANEDHQLYAVMAFIGISCLSVLLSLIRVIIAIKQKLSKPAVQQFEAIDQRQMVKEERFEDISTTLHNDINNFKNRLKYFNASYSSGNRNISNDYTVPLQNFLQSDSNVPEEKREISSLRKYLLEQLKENKKEMQKNREEQNMQ